LHFYTNEKKHHISYKDAAAQTKYGSKNNLVINNRNKYK